MSKFEIDFFELCFLAESCIPPRPIARAMFWDDLINKHYFRLTSAESEKMFDWITRNSCFDILNEDCRLFHSRFDPSNQYQVTTLYEGNIEIKDCFMQEGRYYLSKTQSIYEKYITSVEKKVYEKD